MVMDIVYLFKNSSGILLTSSTGCNFGTVICFVIRML